MGAVYPADVAVFTTKVDLVDDVMAEHVNSLQSEVNAIETVVGRNPATEPAFPGGRAVAYTTVSERIHKLGEGANVLVCAMQQTQGLWVPKSGDPWGITLYEAQNFYGVYDPFHFGINWGLRLPEDGWWVISAQINWTRGNSTGATVRKASIQFEHATRANTTVQSPGNARCDQQVYLEGFFPKNTKVGLAAGLWMSSTNEAGLSIDLAWLTARHVRKPVT